MVSGDARGVEAQQDGEALNRLFIMTGAALFLAACSCSTSSGTDGGASDGGSKVRCETDLSRFIVKGSGSVNARKVAFESELLAGPNAQGRVGDYLLENDLVRVIVQGGGRVFSPLPYGGTILDADLKRSGENLDQFGELGLLYNFGRTLKPDAFEVLADGADGKAAIVAASGTDTNNDWLSIRNKLVESLGRVPRADPFVPVPLRITNYFILNPGEQRVRFVTSFCNVSASEPAALAVGDMVDPGYVLEFLNPKSCTNGFGFGGACFGLDRMSWFGYQGDRVAYGYAPFKAGSPLVPETQNATLSVAGITGSIVGANGIPGLVSWINDAPTPREGELRLSPGESAVLARDFWIARDLGQVALLIETSRATATLAALATLSGTVRSSGHALAGARVLLEGDTGREVYTTLADGSFSAQVVPGAYTVSAWAPGRQPSARQTVTATAAVPASVALDLVDPHRLTVTVSDVNGGPMPAKVTVLCRNGPCPVVMKALVPYTDILKDPLPTNVQLVGRVAASGSVTLELPPGQYDVLVSRGPEYSIYPNTYPAEPGAPVDLRTADATIATTLARVLDTPGWMSSDFHVHAVNSPDSIVDNETRALSFAADGVEVLVGTDHDVVTDYGPVIVRAGLAPFLASVIGEEISPMEFGHYNLFPLTLDAADHITGGNVEWATSEHSLALGQIFAAARLRGAKTVHFNHPRGALGGFTYLKVDTDTFATHADPASLRMAPQPGATANDTRLMSSDFNAFEVLNSAEDALDGTSNGTRARLNDWFTLLSRGVLAAATGVSDTHYRSLATGWRTWVQVGVDAPGQFNGLLLSENLNKMRAVASNGPFVTMKAYRADASGAMVSAAVGIGDTLPQSTQPNLGVQVEVQVPEYLDVTLVELYLHRPEDDLSCPIDPTNARAATTRVSCDGAMNRNWPASGIAASQAVALTPADLEVAATAGATTYRRYRKTVTFTLPAPTTDNWVVALVYGSKSLSPLVFPKPGLTGSTAATTPFALTNPILIDADGNGYDHPPFTAPRSLAPKPVARPPPPPLPTDEASIVKRWGEVFDGH